MPSIRKIKLYRAANPLDCGKARKRHEMARNRALRRHVNDCIMRACEAYDLLAIDVLNGGDCKTAPVTAAKCAIASRLLSTVWYRNAWHYRTIHREYCVSEVDPGRGWEQISLPDIALLMGARDHTTVLRQLRRREAVA